MKNRLEEEESLVAFLSGACPGTERESRKIRSTLLLRWLCPFFILPAPCAAFSSWLVLAAAWPADANFPVAFVRTVDLRPPLSLFLSALASRDPITPTLAPSSSLSPFSRRFLFSLPVASSMTHELVSVRFSEYFQRVSRVSMLNLSARARRDVDVIRLRILIFSRSFVQTNSHPCSRHSSSKLNELPRNEAEKERERRLGKD